MIEALFFTFGILAYAIIDGSINLYKWAAKRHKEKQKSPPQLTVLDKLIVDAKYSSQEFLHRKQRVEQLYERVSKHLPINGREWLIIKFEGANFRIDRDALYVSFPDSTSLAQHTPFRFPFSNMAQYLEITDRFLDYVESTHNAAPQGALSEIKEQ